MVSLGDPRMQTSRRWRPQCGMHGSSRGSNLLLLLPFLLTLLLMLLLAATPSAAEVLQGESPAVPANTSFTSSTPILDQEEDVEGVRWEEEGEHEEARDGLEKEMGEEVERIESEDSDNGGQGDADVDVEEMITYTGDVQDDSPLLLDEDFLPPVTSLDEERPETPMPEGCSSPLGLTTGEVLDWQISASSSYPSSWDPGCHIKYARLHQPNGRAWCAGRKAAGEWVLVDLGVPAKVTGLLTQGKADDEEWVTSFELSYSLDAYHWHYAKDIYNNKKMRFKELHGGSRRIMGVHGSQRFTEVHGSRRFMVHRDSPRFMVVHGGSQRLMVVHGGSLRFMERRRE
ncbi:uncharacterized protein [Penaeus vannamei]|uniref:uncharacterized protein n=1 Tax=Penaeus vannamei TaxID=6689 RepID=UPI00387F6977